jgi:hypothetical protein
MHPFTKPPGLLGDIAEFIYQAAPRPVAEIALAGAIGLMAGISGRAFNVSGVGLNQYILLVSRSGTGKEAIAEGIDKLMGALEPDIASVREFIGPSKFSSGAALLKYIGNKSQCFVSIIGEVGITFQQMSSPRCPPYLSELKQVYLSVYSKSGRGKKLHGVQYSSKDDSTFTVDSPAVSIVGEGTPATVYGSLSEAAIIDGFLPRFLLIEYDGNRNPLQEMQLAAPWPELTEKLKTLAAYAQEIMHKKTVIEVEYDAEAKRILDIFGTDCDARVNAHRDDADEAVRELWNRAHLKVLKLSALVAVGVNPWKPTITPEHAMWAIGIEEANVFNLLSRFEAGEVGGEGGTEDLRIKRVIEAFAAYYEAPFQKLKSYDVRRDLHEKRIVTYTYLHRRLCNTKLFKKQYGKEPTKLLQEAIRVLIERGDIQQIGPVVMQRDYKTTAIGYMFANAELLRSAPIGEAG